MKFDFKKLKELQISETGFLFDPATGHTFTLNKVAREILLLFQQGCDLEGIKKKIMEKFEVAPAVLDKDISDFIQQGREFGLLA